MMEPAALFLQGESSFDTMKETIRDNYFSDRFRGKLQLLSLNGGYARILGRMEYHDIQLMTNGMLNDNHSARQNMKPFVSNLDSFHQFLAAEGIPFLYILSPYKIPLEESLLPAGAKDTTNTVMDEMLAGLTACDIPVLDLRQSISRSREQIEKYLYRTDHHWKASGAFYAYQLIMEAVQQLIPGVEAQYADPSLWKTYTVPQWFLGSQGKPVGTLFGGIDDLEYMLPDFETEMSRFTPGYWAYQGDFRKVNINEWYLENTDYLTTNNYYVYMGGDYALSYHRNSQAKNKLKVLLIEDSTMLPVECFLSTEFTALDSLDPRIYTKTSIVDYVSLNPPDLVIMMNHPTTTFLESERNFGQGKKLALSGPTLCEEKELLISGKQGQPGWQTISGQVEPGKNDELILQGVDVLAGSPEGLSAVLYDGDERMDETVFDLEYGNRFGFRWGFHAPEKEDAGPYQLLLYAGIAGETDSQELLFHEIRLNECFFPAEEEALSGP